MTSSEYQVYILMYIYGFNPPHKSQGGWQRTQYLGKYEPDRRQGQSIRSVVLAGHLDGTNVIAQYNPALNYVIAYHVAGTLAPLAVGNYTEDGESNDKPSYSNPQREFIIRWDGIDSWLIAEQWAGPDNPHWKRTNASIVGVYTPQNSATGEATVSTGPE